MSKTSLHVIRRREYFCAGTWKSVQTQKIRFPTCTIVSTSRIIWSVVNAENSSPKHPYTNNNHKTNKLYIYTVQFNVYSKDTEVQALRQICCAAFHPVLITGQRR